MGIEDSVAINDESLLGGLLDVARGLEYRASVTKDAGHEAYLRDCATHCREAAALLTPGKPVTTAGDVPAY